MQSCKIFEEKKSNLKSYKNFFSIWFWPIIRPANKVCQPFSSSLITPVCALIIKNLQTNHQIRLICAILVLLFYGPKIKYSKKYVKKKFKSDLQFFWHICTTCGKNKIWDFSGIFGGYSCPANYFLTISGHLFW